MKLSTKPIFWFVDFVEIEKMSNNYLKTITYIILLVYFFQAHDLK